MLVTIEILIKLLTFFI